MFYLWYYDFVKEVHAVSEPNCLVLQKSLFCAAI